MEAWRRPCHWPGTGAGPQPHGESDSRPARNRGCCALRLQGMSALSGRRFVRMPGRQARGGGSASAGSFYVARSMTNHDLCQRLRHHPRHPGNPGRANRRPDLSLRKDSYGLCRLTAQGREIVLFIVEFLYTRVCMLLGVFASICFQRYFHSGTKAASRTTKRTHP